METIGIVLCLFGITLELAAIYDALKDIARAIRHENKPLTRKGVRYVERTHNQG